VKLWRTSCLADRQRDIGEHAVGVEAGFHCAKPCGDGLVETGGSMGGEIGGHAISPCSDAGRFVAGFPCRKDLDHVVGFAYAERGRIAGNSGGSSMERMNENSCILRASGIAGIHEGRDDICCVVADDDASAVKAPARHRSDTELAQHRCWRRSSNVGPRRAADRDSCSNTCCLCAISPLQIGVSRRAGSPRGHEASRFGW